MPRDSVPKYLHTLFESSRIAYPHNSALEVDGRRVSYQELDAAVEETARAIRELVPRPVRRAVLLYGPTHEAYVRYLALLRIGAVVIPLDHSSPQARVANVLTESHADLVIGPALVPGVSGVYQLALDGSNVVDASADTSMPRTQLEEDLEYILFTSGSTGRPKAVPIGRAQLECYIPRAIKRYEVTGTSRLSQNFALSFDLSVFDLFVCWAAGATLCVPHGREGITIAHYVNRAELTHWFGVPSALSVASELHGLEGDSMPNLKVALTCGEPLFKWQAEKLAAAAPNARIFNLYGPTELTISCADYELPSDPSRWPENTSGTVPIGDVHEGLVAALNDNGQQVADKGELIVRGPQRFQGYLNRADNEGAFVRWEQGEFVNGIPTDYGAFYRTGDIVTRQEGNLFFVGRQDRQVKVGGFRVELNEVEMAVRAIPGVQEAVVTTQETSFGSSQLACAFTGLRLAEEAIRSALTATLPSYMIPRTFMHWEDFPLTAHGKVDRLRIGELLQTPQGGRRSS